MAREVPIRIANNIGPARSPIVLLTCSPFSAKVEAHWLTACSHAPAQTINNISTQNTFLQTKSFNLRLVSFSAMRGAIGTLVKAIVLTIGMKAQKIARNFQLCMPNMAKNKVESRTTPT